MTPIDVVHRYLTGKSYSQPIFSFDSAKKAGLKAFTGYMTRPAGSNGFFITRMAPGREGVGVHATDPVFANMVIELHDAVEAKFPPSAEVGNGALEYPGIPNTWSHMRTVAGLSATKEGSLVPHNASIPAARLKYGMTDRLVQYNIDTGHLSLLKHIARRIFARPSTQPEYIPIKQKTSVGPPFLTNDTFVKEALLNTFETHAGEIGRALGRSDYTTLASYGYYALTMVGRRYQADPAKRTKDGFEGKVRIVPTYTGEYVRSDKTLPDTIYRHKERVAARSRGIAPVNMMASLPARYVATCATANVHERLESTYVHRGHADVADKLKGALQAMGIDMSAMDAGMPLAALLAVAEVVGEIYGPAYGANLLDLLTGSIVTTADTRGEKGYVWSGDTSQGSGQTEPGLLSGVPVTALVGKVWGTFNVCVAASICGMMPLTAAAIDDVMTGDSRRTLGWWLINAGDDNLVCAGNQRMADAMKGLLQASPYADFSLSPTFLGGVLVQASVGRFDVLPSLPSLYLGFLVPGRSADDPQRGWWAQGRSTIGMTFGVHPNFTAANAMLDEAWGDHFGVTLSDVVARALQMAPKYDVVTYEDAEFVANPDAIYYKIDERRVSERVKGEFIEKWTADRFLPAMRNFEGGYNARHV